MLTDQNKSYGGGGMDQDSAPEYIAPNDYRESTNFRVTGTAQGEEGYGTNIESNTALSGALLPGVNKVIGGGKFNDTGQILAFRFNSAGNCQMLLYDSKTQAYQVIFTDVTDSGGETLLPLNPQNIVTAILVNKTYAIWWAEDLEVGYTNLNTLASGGYGTTLLWEDLSLLKPQCMIPPTGTYGSDPGTPSNYLYSNLGQFTVQYVNADFNYSAWSTWSKRLTPYQENTPTLGADVSQNNYIIVSVNIGTIRATIINVACRFGLNIFYNIKSVTRDYVVALPNTSVNVSTEVFEAYNPITNLYSFAFYNNTINIPVPTAETNLNYDVIWPSNAGSLINGNIAGLGDWKTLYARPNTSVTINAGGYDPNIDIPAGTFPDPLTMTNKFYGASGSGLGDHKRSMHFTLSGTPHTGDKVIVILADIRNAQSTLNYTYTVPSAQDGNLAQVVQSVAEGIGNSSYFPVSGGWTIAFTSQPYYGAQTLGIQLFFAGATVANSIPSIPDNSQGQLALSYRDYKGRFLPLSTNNTYMWNSPSYAQVDGNAIELSWTINDLQAPEGAFDYQWLITAPTVLKIVDTIATILIYKGGWDAKTNNPALAINSGNVGDTYQITTPESPLDTAHYTNLGHNDTYNTGDYIVDNALSYDVLPKDFGDLTNNGILAFSLNSLKLYDSNYQQVGVDTILAYDFTPGDRCTLHYWIDSGGVINYFNQPCIDLAVLGYDAGNYIVKVENSAALVYTGGHIEYNGQQIDVRNIFLRLYSPALQNQTSQTAAQSTTVWYEIGERFPVTNGQHSVLTGVITDGGVYFKTRQFDDGVTPYSSPPINVLATDLNYSDFYASAFWSAGRTRTYYDELEKTTRAASIITSQNYILGSKNNGLNRFYPSAIYGESDGQTSSSQGEIQVMWQRGQELVIMQELGVFYIPVNIAYTQINDSVTQESISSKLLNNGRYSSENVGIGTAKESFCTRYDKAYFVSPQYSEPFEINVQAGIRPISQKMSKFFKSVIQLAYQQGKKLLMYYNEFYEEPTLCIEADSGILLSFPFNTDFWNPMNSFSIVPGNVSATPNGSHCTASYNVTTGVVTYTPAVNYVGTDSATFTFNPGSGNVTVNNCLQWTAGSGAVNPFSFAAVSGADLSTEIASNTIIVSGNDFPVAISIVGTSSPQYNINSTGWTSSPGTVSAGDIVQVRLISAGSPSNIETATLTIDGQSAEFDVVTKVLGNFTLRANYGITIASVTNVTTTGVPAAFAMANVPPGSNLSAVYTTVTNGQVHVNITGTPVLPGHTRLYWSVSGVNVDTSNLISGQTLYSLNLPVTQNDPTVLEIGVETFA